MFRSPASQAEGRRWKAALGEGNEIHLLGLSSFAEETTLNCSPLGSTLESPVQVREVCYISGVTPAEAIYEEIDHRLITKRMTQTGSALSKTEHSGYEDVDEGLLSGKAVNEEKPEYYNNVTTSDLKGDVGTEDTPENYDDVITAGQTLDRLAEDKVELYDDVISAGENPNITS
ncbi:hypothetical protein NFI96_029328, partial [Prochilodus magdalenae]